MTCDALDFYKILKNVNKFLKIIKIDIQVHDIYNFDFMKRNYIIVYKFHEKIGSKSELKYMYFILYFAKG